MKDLKKKGGGRSNKPRKIKSIAYAERHRGF